MVGTTAQHGAPTHSPEAERDGHPLAGPGSYALLLLLEAPANLTIGRRGSFLLSPGNYVYLGSAHGPGGLRARLNHHIRSSTRFHWHIDWLRPICILEGFCTRNGLERVECTWAQALAAQSGAAVPVPGFGAGDCTQGCTAHLVYFAGGITPLQLEAYLPGDRIHSWTKMP